MTHSPRTRRIAALLTAAILAVAAIAPVSAARPDKVDFWLTVLHGNDGESKLLEQLLDVDPTGAVNLQPYAGISRFKTLVDNLKLAATEDPPASQRGAKRGVIMLSSGDNFLAGPTFEASLRKGVPFYDSIGQQLVGYDASAIGNHEFDFGPEVLADFISGFDSMPFLSANLDVSAEPSLAALEAEGRIAASTVIKERGELIGVVGATTPQLRNISSPEDVVADTDVAGAIQAEVDALTAAGVNKIILVSHLQNINEERALAPMLSGVDVYIAGGGDELLANPGTPLVPGDVISPSLPYPLTATDLDGKTVPVITTSGDYKYVGRLSVSFDKAGNVTDVDEAMTGPVRVSGNPADADSVAEDPTMEAMVIAPVTAFIDGLKANVIGTTQVPLNGRRGTATDNATTFSISQVGVRNSETNLGNLTADSMLWQAQEEAATFGLDVPQVGLQNGGGIRNNSEIPVGNLTELDTFSILSFSNFVAIKEDISATQFKAILETSISEIGNGRFGQWSGVAFTYDATRQRRVIDGNTCAVSNPGDRIRDVTVGGVLVIDDGVVLDPTWTVDIATANFTFNGGDCYDFGPGGFTPLTGFTYQAALLNYIVAPTSDGGLGGLVSNAMYPVGGEGRIVRLAP